MHTEIGIKLIVVEMIEELLRDCIVDRVEDYDGEGYERVYLLDVKLLEEKLNRWRDQSKEPYPQLP